MNVRWYRLVLLMLIVLSLTITSQTTAQSPADRVVVRIHTSNFEEARTLSSSGLDLLEMRDGDDLFAIVTPAEKQNLIAQGWDVREDAEQTTLLNNPQLDTVQGGYRTVEEGYALLNTWNLRFANLAEVFTYGSSWDLLNPGGPAGYPLKGITLTNELIPGPKPTFFMISEIHAREMSTAELNLRFIEYLLSNYQTNADVHWLLDYHQIVLVPFVNPDGRKIAESGQSQRKNRNTVATPGCSGTSIGVDLNRNSTFHWGGPGASTYQCDATYRGPSAGSEPEVASLQQWIRGVFPDRRGPGDNDPAPADTSGVFISLHSYSNLVLWPYGDTTNPAPNSADLSGLGTKFASYNGYTPQQSVGLYATSGATDDWSYGELGIASFTFEVGPEYGTCSGFFPDFRCMDAVYSPNGNFWGRNLPAFIYASKVARTPYITQRGPDALNLNILTPTLTLKATISDISNGSQPIMAARAYIDIPPWQANSVPITLTASDGAFNSVSEAVQGVLPEPTAGRHIVYVRGQDNGGNWGAVSAIWLDIAAPEPPNLTYIPFVTNEGNTPTE